MFNIFFAGPVFGPEDTLGLLLLLLITSLPFIFLGTGVILLIRDAIKKDIHRSTVIFVGIGLLLFVLLKMTSGII